VFQHYSKGKFVHVYNKAPCHEGIWGSGDITLQSLDFTIGIGEWSASCPSCFSLREKPL